MVKNGKKSKYSIFLSTPKIILTILRELGEITIKSFFPHPYYHFFCEHHHREHIYSSFSRLKKEGLIKQKTSGAFCLTDAGRQKAPWAYLETKTSLWETRRKEKWDGLWRMIIFDVPENKRRLRDDLRYILKVLGFKELQKSIWVTPYKIPDFLREVLWEEGIKPFTRFVTIKNIDYDKDLMAKFELKK